MKLSLTSVLFALALPLGAQEPVVSESESIFYKAFWLERKSPPDPAGAMVLYEQFLTKAPESAHAAEAAERQYRLLDRTGKTKERDAFRAKYEKLLAGVTLGNDRAPANGSGERGQRDGERGRTARDAGARVAELESQLAKAKAEGDEEAVKRLEQQIERAKQAGGDRRMGPGGGLFGSRKLTEMDEDEIAQVKQGLGRMEERLRERAGDEQTDKVVAGIESLKKSLDAGNREEAQKALDALRESMPRRQRGGGGGEGGRPGRQRGGDGPDRPAGGGDDRPAGGGEGR
jgi:hypothetical protein